MLPDVHRLVLAVCVVSTACAGSAATTRPGATASNRAVAGCTDVLRGFAPRGGVVVESIALAEVRAAAAAEEERSFACLIDESDDACLQRAERVLVADDPGTVVHEARLVGEPAGVQGLIDVDGRPYQIIAATDAEFAARALALQAGGHVVTPLAVRPMYREATRQARMRWSLPAKAPATPAWEARVALRAEGDGEAGVAAALAAAQEEAARLGLTIARWERTDLHGASLTLACPR
jgi:hypothetical protein